MYSISHPNKHGFPLYDLTDDQRAISVISENLSCRQAALERVITRTLSEYNMCCSVDDDLRALFKAKLWRMGQKISKAGSIARKKILEAWKSGANSLWEIQINVENFKKELAKEKKEFATEKKVMEEKVQSEHLKRLQLEEELSHSKLVLKETTLHHQFQNQQLVCQLNTTQTELKKAHEENKALLLSNKRLSFAIAEQGSAAKKKRQDITLLTRQQQWVRRKQLHNNVSHALLFLENEGIKATSLTMLHTESSKVETLDLEKGKFLNNQSEENDILGQILYIKERFGISDSAYHELSMACGDLPCSCNLKKVATQLNEKWEIKPCPNGNGIQQSIESRLKERVRMLIKNRKISCGDTLQVKLSGDGTKVCRKLNLINITFTLLNEGDVAKSPRGNHSVAIINGTENYNDLRDALSDICQEVENLATLNVDGLTFPLEYFLCSDLKFLAIICGIENATSTYPCIWCTCSKSERHDMDKTWSIEDVKNGARTVESIISCLTKSKANRYGCIHAPLFPTISITHIIPDVLHLFYA